MDFYPNTTQELTDAILTANSTSEINTIHLKQNGIYNVTSPDAIYSSAAFPFIRREVTIEGNGATITCTSTNSNLRLFVLGLGSDYTEDSRFIINNLSLQGSSRAIELNGDFSVEINKCTFQNNTGDSGSAITSYNAKEIWITESIFRDNINDSSGALLLSYTKCKIADCGFYKNIAAYGGAISSWGELDIKNCLFEANSAVQTGGAIYTFEPSQIENSIFKNNHAGVNGGALFTFDESIINRCLFEGNSSSMSGGACWFSSSGLSQINNSEFRANVAVGVGGAIQAHSFLAIEECLFENNQSGDIGGAIVAYTSPIEIRNTTFQQNEAAKSGGAIAAYNNVDLQYCTLNENRATESGGAFATWGSNIAIDQSIFTRNSCDPIVGLGGAIHITAHHNFSLNNSLISNNIASAGSALYKVDFNYNTDVSIYIWNSIIHSNANIAVYNASTVAIDASENWWVSPDGPSGAAPGSGDAISANVLYTPFYSYAPPIHDGVAPCPCGYKGNDGEMVGNPISLRLGEKREEVEDLRVLSPQGALTFTRFYRQSQQAQHQFMGMGWSHNHHITLVETTDPDKIIVTFDRGDVHFSRVGETLHYQGDPGSVSFIDKDGDTGAYTLTASDESIYAFDADGKLLAHTLTSGDAWTYSYTDDNLASVSDGYGRSLQFSYYNGLIGDDAFKNGQLWRVGDHSSSDLNEVLPAGRYVEFDYSTEYLDGLPMVDGLPLLTSAQDVRGFIWTYRYYGATVGETEVDQANFLTERLSPSVDTTGDGAVDAPIVLEAVAYTVSGSTVEAITQQRGDGLLETDFVFQPGGADVTTETAAGRTTVHRFYNGVYAGTNDPAGQGREQIETPQHRPWLTTDANGHDTQLRWSTDGKHLEQVVDALGQRVEFTYNLDDTLATSTDAEGRTTEYAYDDPVNPRQPTEIKVIAADGVTVLRWQTFTYDAKGRVLTEAVIDPNDGVTVLQQTTRTYGTTGNGNGLLESLVQHDLIDSGNNVATTYTYDSVGRVVKVQKSSLFGSCDVSYTVYDAAGHVLASICNYSPGSSPAPTTPAEAVALYDPMQPDKNRVTTHVYDALGRRVATTTNAGAAFAQTTLTVYDALDRVIRTITNYVPDVAVPHPYTAARSTFDHGADNTQNLITEMAYNARGLTQQQVDVLGNVTLYGYDDADRLVKTVQNASQPSYDNDYSGDPDLSAYVAASAADQDMVTEQAYDAVGNLVRSVDVAGRVIYTVYDPLNRPVKTVRNAKAAATLTLNPGDSGYLAANDPRSDEYMAVSDSDRDQIETTEYDALGRVIRTRQVMSAWPELEWETALYGYDALGRQVKTIRSASQPDYMLLADPDLSEYVASNAADLDLIQRTAYDPSGRVLYTEDTNGTRTWTAYDGLGRPVKTIANAVGTATDDSADDPRSALYVPSGDADRDLISQTAYDSDGRVQSTEDALGRVTWMVYDSLGRTIRTVQNYLDVGEAPGVWEWHAGWTESDGITLIDHGADNDRNLVTETVYDAQGRVEMTFDTRHNAMRFIYDSLGRRVLTISGYVAQGASDPADWLWSDVNGRWEDGSGNAIDHSAAYTQNILSATVYDLGGRVLRVRDPLGIETRYEYDAAGRRVLTITNDVDGLYDPNIPDEDLNAMMVYDKAGQVVATLDARGTKTTFTYDHAGRRQTVTQAAETPLATTHYTCYDKAGRVLRQISNWIDAGVSPDARDTLGNWLFAPEAHGPYADQNLITAYVYDRAGRRIEQRDPVGNATAATYFKDGQVDSLIDPESMVTVYRYDLARRRNLVVQGYEAQATDPGEWAWNALAEQWEEV